MPPAFDTFEYIRGLPVLAWEAICSFLDGGSLLAFAEAVPSLESIAFQERFVRALKFTPDTDERTIKYFHAAGISNHVQKLDFNNCIGLPPEALLGCASSCSNLQELCCVNCVIHPVRLFALLATELNQVRILEWSLHDNCFYKTLPVPMYQPPNMQVENMYIELVATSLDFHLVMEVLRRFPRLQKLHVHSILYEGVQLMSDLSVIFSHYWPSLSTLTVTCEGALLTGALIRPIRWERVSPPFEYIPFGNVSYQLKPVSSSSLVLFEDERQDVQLTGVKQAVVAMETDSDVTRSRLCEAISVPQRWGEVSSLCLVLLPPRGQQTSVIVTASRRDIDATHLFLETCVFSITELNLASFHFDNNTDGASIVGSTLHQLRALAITPCGASHADSLTSLAQGCKNLEQLDIRAERYSNGCEPHECCRVPLQFSEACFKSLHGATRLWQLRLDDSARLTSLDFLRECRVTELGFSLKSIPPEMTYTAAFHLNLSRLLRANPRLSSLTIDVGGIPIRKNVLATGLAAISTLRHLCVLTQAVSTKDEVASFFGFMQAELPLLQVLHAHYANKQSSVIPVTWLRQWRPFATRLRNGKQRLSQSGVLLYRRPCIGCYRRSFIGLAKPRNHV